MEGTLRIRVRDLGSQWEKEKGAWISDPTPCRHPSLPLAASQLRAQCRKRSPGQRVRCFQ